VALAPPSFALPFKADLWTPHPQSSSYTGSKKKFSISYSQGESGGLIATDVMKVGSLSVAAQAFGAVTTESSDWSGDDAAGLVGLAFSSISSIGKPTFIENLIAQGALSSPLFAFSLRRNQKSGSELSIGALDSSRYSGAIQYNAVTSLTYWQIKGQAVVAGSKVGNTFTAAIDSGTTYIFLPVAVAKALMAQIPGASRNAAQSSTGYNVYQFPCSSTTKVGFSFAGGSTVYYINAADLNAGTAGNKGQCISTITGKSPVPHRARFLHMCCSLQAFLAVRLRPGGPVGKHDRRSRRLVPQERKQSTPPPRPPPGLICKRKLTHPRVWFLTGLQRVPLQERLVRRRGRVRYRGLIRAPCCGCPAFVSVVDGLFLPPGTAPAGPGAEGRHFSFTGAACCVAFEYGHFTRLIYSLYHCNHYCRIATLASRAPCRGRVLLEGDREGGVRGPPPRQRMIRWAMIAASSENCESLCFV